MEKKQENIRYESLPESELIKMWDDIQERNLDGLNRSLMKSIGKNENERDLCGLNRSLMKAIGKNEEEARKVGQDDIPLYSKRIWNTEMIVNGVRGGWDNFSLRLAHLVVNERKEPLVMQIFRPTDIQPEYGPIIKGWLSFNSSFVDDLTEMLKNKKFVEENFGDKTYYEMVKQDHQELRNEGRYDELPGYKLKRNFI